MIEEPESAALAGYLGATPHILATSRIALVEVPRAVAIANPSPGARAEVERLLDSCLLVDLGDTILRVAAGLTSREVRTRDAIHLASAQRVGAEGVLAYDRRLAFAAGRAGLSVTSPV